MRSVSRYASFIIFLLLIGCVDSREIDHRSMIVGIGIDQTEDEQFSVTVQIPILQPTDGGASTSNREFKTFTAVGDTVLDAIAQIESQTPTVLFFGHLKVVLFGEKIAAANLKEALEMLDRIPAVANQIYLLIIEGHSVEKFLEIESPLVALPAMYLNRFFQADQKISRTTDVKLFEYQRDIKMISSTTSIPLAHTGKGIITIEDMAVLKDNKLIAKLRGNEVAMSELLKHGKTDEFNYTATMEHNHEQIKVAVSRSKLKATIDFNKSNPVQFVIHIEGEGEIVEIGSVKSSMKT